MGIDARNIHKFFGTPGQEVLKGIDLHIDEGEFVSINGRSGSGKSTLLYILSSLDPASAGELELDGKNIHAMSDEQLHRFRNEKMGFVFQFHYLLPELTAIENVLMPTRKTKSENARRTRAIDLMNEFGLSDKLKRLPGELSGGEQQRVAIARALIMEPSYIFADEPTGNLDSINGDLVMQIFRRISREQKTTVIMVTHDPDYAALADRSVHIADGRIVV
ncbi:MAG: ABC transporter ATP-binding protein [Gammaproteobacteria bacterium]|nr:ABC transporter ATP-binding protein [Gammaproteobacteria bacterium]